MSYGPDPRDLSPEEKEERQARIDADAEDKVSERLLEKDRPTCVVCNQKIRAMDHYIRKIFTTRGGLKYLDYHQQCYLEHGEKK